jgi:hypothetical protein
MTVLWVVASFRLMSRYTRPTNVSGKKILLPPSALMMETPYFSETLVFTYVPTRHHNPEHRQVIYAVKRNNYCVF